MSRIRSIHPGLWTDEAFVSLSPMARLLLMGLWNECDDMGSFAWAPLTLKMRILPADSADAAALLDEMIEGGIVMRYDVGGKTYGAVRNFCQYQRPKKPNSTFPQTPQVQEWVNTQARSTRDGGEAVPNQLPTGGEKLRQMEDGGGSGSSSVSNETVPISPEDEIPALKPEHVPEVWNARLVPLGLPAARKMTPERRKKLNTFIRRHTIDDITEAIAAIEVSPFLRGENDRGWKPNIDWMLEPKNFTKLTEGTYGR